MKSINTQPSEQAVYIWNIVGSIANALLSVIVLMLVTRTLDGKQTDIFSIGWAISQLMVTIGTYQIRTYQATDVKECFKFRQYLLFRIITVTIMLIISFIYVIAKKYDVYKSLIIFIICIFRAVDALADVYEGWFQQKERLDLAGKAVTGRIIIGIVCFGLTLFCTRNLLCACMCLTFCYIISFIVYDIRYTIVIEKLKKRDKWERGTKWFFKLAIEGLPIFINAFLMMAISNTPKMVIDAAIENGGMEEGIQTVLSILFLPASVLTLAYIVFRPMLTRMAIMWTNGKIKEFIKIIIKLIICLLGMVILLLVGSSLMGIPVLSFIYAVDLSPYKRHLLIIILGGCFCTFSYVFDNALIIIRKQYILVFSYVVTWVYVGFVAEKMTDIWGVMGAALAYTTAMAVFFIITAVIFVVCFKNACKNNIKVKVKE